MSLFNPTREQVRRFFFETWQKFNQQQTLTDLEKIALQVIHLHPEYHEILSQPQRYLDQEYFPELGETNPFLHMSLHVSIIEQLRIDQPPGIRALFAQLQTQHGNEHDAYHDVLDCLGEMVWRAQREQKMPDNAEYLACLQHKIKN